MSNRKILFGGIMIGAVLTALILWSFMIVSSKPIGSSAAMLYIDEDDNADSVFHKLENGIAGSSLHGLKTICKVKGYDKYVKSGAYQFKPKHTCLDIYRTLSRGHQTPVKLIVPNLRTVDRIIGKISEQIMADSAKIAEIVFDSAQYSSLGFNHETLPALFIPNTYEVYWNMSAEKLMKRLVREYNKYWNEKRRTKAAEIGLTPIEVSILASIVDEETANNAEKPMVAGLYINRLKRGMLLQADPTVKFAMQNFTLKRILQKHLHTDSPYNTYKYAGLPPGPIRVPSLQALESVLNYTRHKYLYMCAKEDFSGTHNFAVTLSQHNANARRYQQELNRRKIR